MADQPTSVYSCAHLNAFSETGRSFGGHHELHCDECNARFVSLPPSSAVTSRRIGIVEKDRRNGALIRFGNPNADSVVHYWRLDRAPATRCDCERAGCEHEPGACKDIDAKPVTLFGHKTNLCHYCAVHAVPATTTARASEEERAEWSPAERADHRAQTKRKNWLNGEVDVTLLAHLQRAGHIWLEDGCYVGRAADGKVVQIGNIGDEQTACEYLAAHPTPSTW